MTAVGLVVEGLVDRAAAQALLGTRGLDVDPMRVIVTGGKSTFNTRLVKYNQAARFGGWLALRDSDRDASDCPATLRRQLLSVPQSPALCLRLAVRTIESWLLADSEALARHFAIPPSKVPAGPEDLPKPKDALVEACRSSKRRAVRVGMVPPKGKIGTGPEYTASIQRYCREDWRPDVAAASAPSLARALREIDRLVTEHVW